MKTKHSSPGVNLSHTTGTLQVFYPHIRFTSLHALKNNKTLAGVIRALGFEAPPPPSDEYYPSSRSMVEVATSAYSTVWPSTAVFRFLLYVSRQK